MRKRLVKAVRLVLGRAGGKCQLCLLNDVAGLLADSFVCVRPSSPLLGELRRLLCFFQEGLPQADLWSSG
jgi:hypothetical protein